MYGQETIPPTITQSPLDEAKLLPDEKLPEILQDEAEILKTLDEFSKAQQTEFIIQETLTEEFVDSVDSKPVKRQFNDEQLLLDDSFDQVDIEQILEEDLSSDLLSTQPPITTDELADDKSTIGVGIQGEEEAIINKLDNSDLMDFDKDLDIWHKDSQPLESISDDIDDIDDIEQYDNDQESGFEI